MHFSLKSKKAFSNVLSCKISLNSITWLLCQSGLKNVYCFQEILIKHSNFPFYFKAPDKNAYPQYSQYSLRQLNVSSPNLWYDHSYKSYRQDDTCTNTFQINNRASLRQKHAFLFLFVSVQISVQYNLSFVLYRLGKPNVIKIESYVKTTCAIRRGMFVYF